MKQNRTLQTVFAIWTASAFAVSIAWLLAVVLSTSGCKTSPNAVAYKSVASIQSGVKTTMTAWYDYVVDRRAEIAALPVADRGSMEHDLLVNEGKVVAALGKYQETARATQAIIASTPATGPPDTSAMATAAIQLATLINSISK